MFGRHSGEQHWCVSTWCFTVPSVPLPSVAASAVSSFLFYDESDAEVVGTRNLREKKSADTS
jgi:hypothetical protein